MQTTTISLPTEIAEVLFRHLNGDDGWRSQQADKLVALDEGAGRFGAGRAQADEQRKLVMALGTLSAKFAEQRKPGGAR